MTNKAINHPAFLVIINLLVVLFLLTGIEAVFRVFAKPSRLDNILAVLEQDPDVLWKQKNNLNEDFLGVNIVTDEYGLRNTHDIASSKQDKIRILILGASPSFGWGVSTEETYAFRLEALLKKEFGENIEVINASGIGYSSFQGLKFLKKYLRLIKPDIVTVSYVINDIDRYRFFQNNGLEDKALPPVSKIKAGIRNLINKFVFCRSMEKAINSLKQKLLSSDVESIDYSVHPGKNRISAADYESNLKEFVNIARSNNIKLILIKMPVNLPSGPKVISEAKAEKLFERAKDYLKGNSCREAIKFFKSATELNPLLSRAYYFIGKCYSSFGNGPEAEKYFKKVKDVEAFRCAHDASKYNQIMENVALSQNIDMVDIVNAFNDQNEYLFLDPNHDTIHPNEIGHQIIAERILRLLDGKNIIKKKFHEVRKDEN